MEMTQNEYKNEMKLATKFKNDFMKPEIDVYSNMYSISQN